MNYYNYTNSQYNFLKSKKSQGSVSGGSVSNYKPKADLFNIAFTKNSGNKKISGKGINDNIKFII